MKDTEINPSPKADATRTILTTHASPTANTRAGPFKQGESDARIKQAQEKIRHDLFDRPVEVGRILAIILFL
jgi:hypothetical protein